MESQVEEIKQKINVAEVIGQYVTLTRSGRNFKGLCPFHGERTPSFMVSTERGTWRCFGCGEHGDVFTFLEKYEHLSFSEALEQMAKRAGVTLEKRDQADDRDRQARQRLYDLVNLAAEYYSFLLHKHPLGEPARVYLAERRIAPEIVERYRLGFAPDSWQSLTQYLAKKGFGRQELAAAGLTSQNDRGKEYDRFRNRLMFTVTDSMGRAVGFSGRSLEADPQSAKYLNNPEGPLFHKGSLLYGLDQAKEAIRKDNKVILVEGNVDVLSSAQVGVGNVVAPLGTALTDNQVAILKRFTNMVYVAFDMDKAGQEATRRAIDLLRQAGLEIRVVVLPGGKDPDECIKQNPEEWKRAVLEATDVVSFFLMWANNAFDLTTERGASEAADVMLSLFVSNTVSEQSEALLLSKIAAGLRLDEQALRQRARRLIRDGRAKPALTPTPVAEVKPERPKPKPLSRAEKLAEYFLVGLLALPIEETPRQTVLSLLAEVEPGALAAYDPLAEGLRALCLTNEALSVDGWLARLSSDDREVLERLNLTDSGTISDVVNDRLDDLRTAAADLNRLYFKHQLDTLSRLLKQAELLDKDKVASLQQEFIRISQKLAAPKASGS